MWTLLLSAGAAQTFSIDSILHHRSPYGKAKEVHVSRVEHERLPVAEEIFGVQSAEQTTAARVSGFLE